MLSVLYAEGWWEAKVYLVGSIVARIWFTLNAIPLALQ